MQSIAALADPTRRKIVELLARGERPAGDIVKEFSMSAPAISQHLKVLREAGLVSVRVNGQQRIHALNPDGFNEIETWLEQMRAFWSSRLDALEAALREEDRENKHTKTTHEN